jgi:pimeloyl-ACP methyl ester carboxylesterase
MPYAPVGDVDIYYEIHGPHDAPPLVLIGGWASYRWIWFRQIPTLMKKYKCIVFDNRGAGKSSKPDYPYTMEMMAADTVGLLDALNIESAHFLGISMGGLVGQQIALSYPEKVRTLILVSTHFGGPNHIPIPDEVVMRQIDEWVTKHPAPLFAQVHQSSATGGFDSESQLKNITSPTLILHGANDFTILPKNSELLAERIPNSKLQFIEGAAHFVIVEKYEEFNDAVMSFIDEVEQG